MGGLIPRQGPQKSAPKKPPYRHTVNKDKKYRSDILSVCIKKNKRTVIMMEAARCRFYVRAIPYLRIWGPRLSIDSPAQGPI